MRLTTVSLLLPLSLSLLGLGGCALVFDYDDYGDKGGSAQPSGGTAGGGAAGTDNSGGAAAAGGTGGSGMCPPGSPDIPLNDVDEDCSGSAAGQALWHDRFGGVEEQSLSQVLADKAGNLFLTGWYHGQLDLGGGKMVGPPLGPGSDMFVARLDPQGSPLWIENSAPDMATRRGEGVAVDSAGKVFVAGHRNDPTIGPEDHGFLLQLDADGASPLEKQFAPGATADMALGVAVDAVDSVYVMGCYRGTTTIEGVPTTSAGGDDALVVKYGPAGNYAWARSFGGEQDDIPRAIAVNEMGESFITGEYRGEPQGLPNANDAMVPEYSAVFVMKLDMSGAVKFKHGFPSATAAHKGHAMGTSIALDSEGNAWVSGAMFGDVAFKKGEPLPYAGGADVFLVKLERSLGDVLWAKSFGDSKDQRATSVAIAEDGSIFLAGIFSGTIDFDPDAPGHELTAKSTEDMFLVKLDAMGKPLWSARFAAAGVAGRRGAQLALRDGQVLIAGGWEGNLDFGSAGISAEHGGLDVFVAALTQ